MIAVGFFSNLGKALLNQRDMSRVGHSLLSDQQLHQLIYIRAQYGFARWFAGEDTMG